MMFERSFARMRIAALSFFTLSPACLAPAQGPTVIRAETQLVLVEASVQDKKGKPVQDLTAKDFHVWEDGKEQTITSLSTEKAAASPEKSPKHYMVLLFDNVTLSMSAQLAARKDAARFAGAWAAPDRYMSVVDFGPGFRVAQSFTTLPDKLAQALGEVHASGQPTTRGTTGDIMPLPRVIPPPLQYGNGRTKNGDAAPLPPSEQQSLNQSPGSPFAQQELLAGLQAVVESLASIRGRKALVLFTGGFPQDPPRAQMTALLSACNRADVAVYAQQSGSFKDLADGTGGGIVVHANDLVGELGHIAEQQEEHYVLGYTPPESPAGSCHDLRVSVDRAGLDVQARKGYCAAKPAGLIAANATAKPVATRPAAPAGNLAASMELPYFYSWANAARVNLAMEIPTAGIKFDKTKGKPHAELHITGTVSKPGGEMVGRFNDAVMLDFAAGQESAGLAKQPYHYEYQLNLAPGQYSFRVTIDAGEGNSGSVEMPLSIESLVGRRLGLSGVALSKETHAAPDLTSALDDTLLEDRRPLIAGSRRIVPSGSNRFHRADLSLAYVEIYDPLQATPNPPQLALRVRVLDRQTGNLKVDVGSFPAANLGHPVVPVTFNLPDSLSVGSYRLEITAAHSSGVDSVVRTADFEIEP